MLLLCITVGFRFVSNTRILKKLGIVDRQVEFGDKNEIDLLYQIGKADLRFGTGPPLASLGCKKW